MNQPRKRLSSDTRHEQFEYAVISLVSEIGFRSVTTDAVAQKTGVSKGLLWRYYTNLDELMQKAAERALGDLEKIIAKDLDLTLPVPELLKETIQRAAQLPRHHRNELLAIQRIVNNLQLPNGSQVLNETNGYEKLYANQSVIMKRGQAEGSIDTTLDPQLLARVYQGAVDAMIDQLMNNSKLDPETYAESLARILLSGFSA